MANLDPAASPGKEKSGFSKAVNLEKNERIARESLHDLIIFHEALENEMQRMTDNNSQGVEMDREFFEKMKLVQEKYFAVMNGFMTLDDDSQSHLLIIFADAVRDLMAYMHHRRAH